MNRLGMQCYEASLVLAKWGCGAWDSPGTHLGLTWGSPGTHLGTSCFLTPHVYLSPSPGDTKSLICPTFVHFFPPLLVPPWSNPSPLPTWQTLKVPLLATRPPALPIAAHSFLSSHRDLLRRSLATSLLNAHLSTTSYCS